MFGWGKLTFLLVVLVVGANAYRGGWKKKCPWVRCEANCRKVQDESGCYKCECTPLCSPPKCDIGCEVQKEFDGPCPGCDCKDIKIEVPLEKICEPVKCEGLCKEVPPLEKGDCPKCVCDEVKCDPPKCPEGCTIEKEFDGPCPGCDCKEEKFGLKPICDPPFCPPGCTIETVYDGPCPGCECKKEEKFDPFGIVCDPPKCPPGCSIQKLYDGPCPGCDCEGKDEESIPKIICDPPLCPPKCKTEMSAKSGCPYCKCEDEEEEEEEDFKEVPMCPAIAIFCDGPKCKLEKDEKGCDTCECEPECAPPKCKRWCKIKNVEGGCPICECPEKRYGWKHKRD